MDTELIIFNEYCQKSHTDPTFIISLEEGGLIEIRTVDGERYLLASQLRELERYSHLYYDLSINIEGLTSYLFLRTMEKWNNERKANFNSPFLLIYGRYISLLIRLR